MDPCSFLQSSSSLENCEMKVVIKEENSKSDDDSAIESLNGESPSSNMKRESPKSNDDSGSAIESLNGESPSSNMKQESPKSNDDSGSAIESLPSSNMKQESPKSNDDSGSAIESLPSSNTKQESPKSNDDSGSAIGSLNGDSLSSNVKQENFEDNGSAAGSLKQEPSTSNSDYSSLIGAVVTQQMVQEEKLLEKKTLEEEKALKQQIMLQQKKEFEEVCYKRLNLLLNRSSLYAQFMADKLQRDQAKESKKQLQAGKRKSRSKGGEPKKLKKSSTDSPHKRKFILEEEEEEEEEIEDEDDSVAEENVSNGQPSLITGGVMHPYQIEGFEWLKVIFENGVNGILADEMGLGKTIQTIAFIAYLIEMGVAGPFFVCGPLSTVPNWYAEFKRFTPSIPALIYHGSQDERAALRNKITKKVKNKKVSSYPVFITSYQIALNDAKHLKRYHWKLLVLDEAHRIKNFQCKLVTSLKLFQTMHRLLLTGTPLQNDLSELWSLLNFILPEIFDDLKVFESWFDVSRLVENGENEIIAKEQEKQIVSKIHEILAPFLLRRTKAEVQLKLPEKKEVIVHAPLTKLQEEYYTAVLNKTITNTLGVKNALYAGEDNLPEKRHKTIDFTKIYKMLEDENFEELPDAVTQVSIPKEIENVFAEVKLNVRNTTMILRKVCNHPYLLSYPYDPMTEEYKIDEDLIKNSGKLLVLDAMLPELKKRGHKVLIFSQFVTMLEILMDYCGYRNYGFCYLYGKLSLEERKEEIDRFNTSDDAFIFLISTKAGGLGLNLAAADTVIIYDSDWNPQSDLQAQDRCHRIGQNKPVIVYRLIVPNTVDEKMVTRANAKRKLEKVIIKKGRFNSNHSMSQKLTIEELIELLQQSDFSGFVKTDDNCVLSPEKLEEILDRSDMAVM